MRNEESSALGMRGFYRDVLYDARGMRTWDSQWRRNTIVIDGRRLLGGFMRGEAGTAGIQGMSLGAGDPAWDALPEGVPPNVNPLVNTSLQDANPYLVADSALKLDYLDPVSGAVSIAPTNRLQIVATLGPHVPNWPDGNHPDGTLREFALVGQLDGASVLINNVRHVAIPKDPLTTLVRTVQLVF